MHDSQLVSTDIAAAHTPVSQEAPCTNRWEESDRFAENFMGKPVPSAVVRNISWCFGPRPYPATTDFLPAAANVSERRNSTKNLVAFSGCSEFRIVVALPTTTNLVRTYGKLSQEFACPNQSEGTCLAHATDQRRRAISRCRSSLHGNPTFSGQYHQPLPFEKWGPHKTRPHDAVQTPTGTLRSVANHLCRYSERIRQTVAKGHRLYPPTSYPAQQIFLR